MDLQLKEELVRLDTNRDYLVNRAADALLDPHRHAFENGHHPFLHTRCVRCHRPRSEHWGLVRRWIVRLMKWRRG